jgi:hypothetical protein
MRRKEKESLMLKLACEIINIGFDKEIIICQSVSESIIVNSYMFYEKSV